MEKKRVRLRPFRILSVFLGIAAVGGINSGTAMFLVNCLVIAIDVIGRGKLGFGVMRTTFIIDENGIIEKVMPKVKPDTNAAEILSEL